MKKKKILPFAKGIDDALTSGVKITETEGNAEALSEVERICGEAGVKPDLPEIFIGTDIKAMADEAIKALSVDPTLYQRAEMLVRIVKDRKRLRLGITRPKAPRIAALPKSSLTERLSARAKWLKLTAKGAEPAFPNSHAVAAVFDRGYWKGIRPLEAIVDYPVLRPDGSVIEEQGYDEDTGILLAPTGGVPTLKDKPTWDDAVSARDALLDVVADFPFQEKTHRACWLAALLTPLCRFAFDGPAPLFLVSANVRGAGKGLLLHVLAGILTGKNMTISTYPQDEDELRKRVTSLVMAGERLVLFDNLTGTVGNGTLDALLTATSWQDRVLGFNRLVDLPVLTTWYGTGNNPSLGVDTIRRTCPIVLESPLEKPELRKDFEHRELLPWVVKNRRRLLGHALTILRAYCVAGRPDMDLPTWGSFESWSSLVRNAIVWAGLPDPGEARQQLQATADTTTEHLTVLLRCWLAMAPKGKGLTVHHVLEKLYPPKDDPHRGINSWDGPMQDAIEHLCGKPNARSLGKLLAAHRRRNIGGMFIDQVGTKKNAIKWAVCPAEELGAED